MPVALGRVTTMASVLFSIMERKRLSFVCRARSRRFSPHAASPMSASMATEVRSVRSAVKRVSSRQACSAACSLLLTDTKSGKPRTAPIDTITGSCSTSLTTRPSKRPSRRTLSASGSVHAICAPFDWVGSGTRVITLPLALNSPMPPPPSPRSMLR